MTAEIISITICLIISKNISKFAIQNINKNISQKALDPIEKF